MPAIPGKEIFISRDQLDNGLYWYQLIGENEQVVGTGKMVVN
jgi:hypothetical protein